MVTGREPFPADEPAILLGEYAGADGASPVLQAPGAGLPAGISEAATQTTKCNIKKQHYIKHTIKLI